MCAEEESPPELLHEEEVVAGTHPGVPQIVVDLPAGTDHNPTTGLAGSPELDFDVLFESGLGTPMGIAAQSACMATPVSDAPPKTFEQEEEDWLGVAAKRGELNHE
jgi:hypothetical protein